VGGIVIVTKKSFGAGAEVNVYLIDPNTAGIVKLLLETFWDGKPAKISCIEGEELITIQETKDKKSIKWEVEFK
jgi:hypothetical protein